MKKKIQIEDVERLVAHPGDTVLVTVSDPVTEEVAHHIKSVFRAALPEGVRVLVKPSSIDVMVIEEVAG